MQNFNSLLFASWAVGVEGRFWGASFSKLGTSVVYLGKSVTSKPEKIENHRWSYFVAPEKLLLTAIYFWTAAPLGDNVL